MAFALLHAFVAGMDGGKQKDIDYGAAARRLIGVMDERAKQRNNSAAGVGKRDAAKFADASDVSLDCAREKDGWGVVLRFPAVARPTNSSNPAIAETNLNAGVR